MITRDEGVPALVSAVTAAVTRLPTTVGAAPMSQVALFILAKCVPFDFG